ncbi:MAG TPA: hypothetical protein DET40_12070 [Lentisphaeria bacterium]|nr:MAG: hypothetical protein A2X45_07625 [Lentisphaerae bacterium GWF2_50_93]HCE44276.1 hypothetical protein [Lentisphaeria bacterium]
MKKLTVFVIAALALSLNLHAEKKTNLVKIQSGETFSDVSKDVTQALSEENTGGNTASLKVVWSGAEGSCGMYNPTLKDWSAASTMVVNVFYPGKAIAKLNLVVVPKDLKGKSRYEGRSDSSYVMKPGQNAVKIPLGDLVTNGGQPLDLKQVVQFYFSPDAKALEAEKAYTVFFQEIYLVFP